MFDTLGQRCCDEYLSFEGFKVPDAQSWFGSNLTSCNNLPIWVHSNTMNIICVVHKVSLRVGLGVHYNANPCTNVRKVPFGGESEIVANIVTSETVHVIES